MSISQNPVGAQTLFAMGNERHIPFKVPFFEAVVLFL
jgi:hypothetical protein